MECISKPSPSITTQLPLPGTTGSLVETMAFWHSAVVFQYIVVLCIIPGRKCFTPSNGFLSVQRFSKQERLRPATAISEKNLSASDKERREEEKRRMARVEDVVVGKTSALLGASDYILNPSATQEQWNRQASRIEQEIARYTDLGMEMIRMLQLKDASDAFDKVFELKPDAYLWQAGIVRYYLDDWEGAADIFARCGTTYESKFGEPASEERIWRNACLLKMVSSLNRKDRKLVEESEDYVDLAAKMNENDDSSALHAERRKVVRISLDLFQSAFDKDIIKTIVCRAKLRSIGGSIDGIPRMDKKLWKISSLFFLGLHFDSLGDSSESKRCIKLALKLRPNANSVDLMHTLPLLHMTCRNWFDDDVFDDHIETKDQISEESIAVGVDRFHAESIRSSVDKMRLVDVQDALRSKGLRANGSKEEAQDRLFDFLINFDDFRS